MNSASKKAFFGDYVFGVASEVYEPAEDSFLFAENLQVAVGARVLDMGTGSGILAILAAEQASEVVAVDVNPYAVRCANQNAKRNGVASKVSFVQSDLFASLAETVKFDMILFNAPYLPSEQGEDASWLGRAWAGGIAGRQIIDRFISQSANHLEKDGAILLMQSTLSNVAESVAQFKVLKMEAKPVARLELPFFETLVLVKAQFSV
ncbi:MAG: class I SAM-dependent methyltransferase [Candidatus Bathyarchaeota archaeon]|nr:class I SAM-dependent methyltransferase [Candidatus Bathyarchaeota archaeon]